MTFSAGMGSRANRTPQTKQKPLINKEKTQTMKSSIKIKTTSLLVIPLVLACFALLPRAQAATPELLPAPKPDGFYTGFNTAEGLNALFNVNTAVGQFNTALGFAALKLDTTGAHNTGVGAQALLNNNGSFNTAVGENALVHNTTGSMNMALGQGGLANNKTGSFNTAMGFQALNANTVDDNTAVGFRALAANSTGDDNTAAGLTALAANSTGFNNTAFGGQALLHNTTSNNNTAVGWNALQFSDNGSGDPNSAVGSFALQHNVTGERNNALGFKALQTNTDGDANNAVGHFALNANLHGDGNNAFGDIALAQSTGDFNTAVGDEAGLNVTSGSGNTFLGQSAGEGVSSANNVICIGQNVIGANTSDRTYIGNIGTFTQAFSAGVNELVTVNLATGRLGHFNPLPSSRRYKEDIKPLDKTSEALFALKPVSYRLKKEFDPAQALAFGLIAEEVEKVNPDLVYRNNKGQVESVRYEMVNAMLLNEFLKEHRKVEEQNGKLENQARKIQEQETTITQLKRGMETVVARLKEQDSKIEKVSAQVEVSKPAPQTVLNNQ
jgi:trimeric autotransporter adhesin